MTRIKDSSLAAAAEAELPWLQRYIPLTRRVEADLSRPTMRGHHIGLNIHLDIKMVPVVEALVRAGAHVTVLGCNPHTTRDSVAALMAARGAEVYAWAGMTEAERQESFRWALSHDCEFISEMGGQLLEAAVREGPPSRRTLRGGMEATGSGILRLQALRLPCPCVQLGWPDAETGTAQPPSRGPDGLTHLYHRHGAHVVRAECPGDRIGLARAAVVVTATGRDRVFGADDFPHLADGASSRMRATRVSRSTSLPCDGTRRARSARPSRRSPSKAKWCTCWQRGQC